MTNHDSALMREFRMTFDDAWGNTMNWLFYVADEIYFNRSFDPPADWQYRPSPIGPSNDPDGYETSIVSEASDNDLLKFGKFLNRYAAFLRRADLDY